MINSLTILNIVTIIRNSYEKRRYQYAQTKAKTAAGLPYIRTFHEGFLELVEELPNCDEKTDLYVEFANETLFDPDEAYRLHYSNELSFEKYYPKGS